MSVLSPLCQSSDGRPSPGETGSCRRGEVEKGCGGPLWICRNPALSRRRASELRSPSLSPASAHKVRFCLPVSRPPRTAPLLLWRGHRCSEPCALTSVVLMDGTVPRACEPHTVTLCALINCRADGGLPSWAEHPGARLSLGTHYTAISLLPSRKLSRQLP